jgi:hypothetical protein
MRDLKTLPHTLTRYLAYALATAALLTGACATSPPPKKEHAIVKMAAFDLNCPKEQLSFQEIDSGTWGVVGCGRRTKYVRICRQLGSGVYESSECRWVQN